ncbi:MAG: hypothetical protein ACPG66_03075 [Flavobacteriales bacterium]
MTRRTCLVVWVAVLCGCREADTPLTQLCTLPAGTQVPQLLAGPDSQPVLAFVQIDESGGRTHAFQCMTWSGNGWENLATVGTDTSMLVNWADRPQLAFGRDGQAFGHWLTLDDRGDFVYSISTVRSEDGGRTWSNPTRPHNDTAVAEHGFAKWLPTEQGACLVWLDGRDFDGHPDPSQARMEVRMNCWPQGDSWQTEVVLDSSACTCCPVTVAPTSDTEYELIYRDREPGEIRDFSRMNIDASAGTWASLGTLHRDGWEIAGCPVNGAALVGNGQRFLASWYTAANNEPRILAAWREAGAASFDEPTTQHTFDPLGRVDVAVDGRGHFYSVWLQANSTGGVDWVGMHWDNFGNPVRMGPEILVAASEQRAGGFPALTGLDEGVLLAWTNPRPSPHVMTAVWRP